MKKLMKAILSCICLLCLCACDQLSNIDSHDTHTAYYKIFDIEVTSNKISAVMQNYYDIIHIKSYSNEQLYNITPNELSGLCELYKISKSREAYLVYRQQVYCLTPMNGGWGASQFAYYRYQKTQRLYYIYSWGSGVHQSEIGMFDFTNQKIKYLDLYDGIQTVDLDRQFEISKDYTLDVYNSYYEVIDECSFKMTKGDLLFKDIINAKTSDYPTHELPVTGLFKLTIIDENNIILNKPDKQDIYCTPGTMFYFYCYPIIDADLGMYINGNFHSLPNYIQYNDDCFWIFEFEMPIEIVVLEFKLLLPIDRD